MNWNNKTVLVTGAGGFIGSHLTERLAALGARTRALVRYNSAGSWGWLDDSNVKDDIEVILGDIRDRDSLQRAVEGVEVIFHLAALIAIPYSYHAPLSYIRTNIEGTANVLQAAISNNVNLVVQTSTSEVYGTAQIVPISEEHPLQGQSPYSASKIGSDKIAESFQRSFGLPIVTVRPFNTYGPRQSARAIIPTIISQAFTQDTIKLGNLDPTRDLNFVADTVEGFVLAASQPEANGQTINLGTGQEISIGDLAAAILRLMNKDLPIVAENARLRPEKSEVERLCADSTKARALLGWTPQHTLEAGLSKTIEWIRQHQDKFRPQVYAV